MFKSYRTYINATAKIHLAITSLSQSTSVEELRQGNTISPKVFTAAMEDIFKKLDLEERGINIDGEQLTSGFRMMLLSSPTQSKTWRLTE